MKSNGYIIGISSTGHGDEGIDDGPLSAPDVGRVRLHQALRQRLGHLLSRRDIPGHDPAERRMHPVDDLGEAWDRQVGGHRAPQPPGEGGAGDEDEEREGQEVHRPRPDGQGPGGLQADVRVLRQVRQDPERQLHRAGARCDPQGDGVHNQGRPRRPRITPTPSRGAACSRRA